MPLDAGRIFAGGASESKLGKGEKWRIFSGSAITGHLLNAKMYA